MLGIKVFSKLKNVFGLFFVNIGVVSFVILCILLFFSINCIFILCGECDVLLVWGLLLFIEKWIFVFDGVLNKGLIEYCFIVWLGVNVLIVYIFLVWFFLILGCLFDSFLNKFMKFCLFIGFLVKFVVGNIRYIV